ncbi:WXG100 family type VII secretion target [Mycobacterium sp. NPDC006124]|uniref:WXG100 family type VII secretion target n=1 Tax=Mycobacterium sp. NPDC006124 TaxID=3156729 RepID=UPI0033BF5698
MTDQKWDFGAIEKSLAELDGEAAATLETLEAERAQLPRVADCWGGTGSEAWGAQQTRWQQRADALAASLHRLTAALHGATTHMNGVDSSVGKLFS